MRGTESVREAAWAYGPLSAAKQAKLDQVVEHSQAALALLDSIAAPANIGAHLQEAIDRISEIRESITSSAPFE